MFFNDTVYMTFSEVNREFKILHTSHKKALNNIK